MVNMRYVDISECVLSFDNPAQAWLFYNVHDRVILHDKMCWSAGFHTTHDK